jgi:phenylalanyl-tRNA synthetase alpha chain
MSMRILSAEEARRALSIRDLTDPGQGPHALQSLIHEAQTALSGRWKVDAWVRRSSPIVSISDNYDCLHYSAEACARDARYTRYLCDAALLRTHTSALVPPALRELAMRDASDVLLVCPGIVYRRDCIDRLHSGEPHQLDLWRIRRGPPLLAERDLLEMIACVVEALLPGHEHRTSQTTHPYTLAGEEIEVCAGGSWVEIGECGIALPELIQDSGLSREHTSGLAMGLGLDRILMLRKGMSDIRLLRSTDPRIAAQMLDLAPYRAVSKLPSIVRDLSVAVDRETANEELGDIVRNALGEDAGLIESVAIVSETPYAELPQPAIDRIGMTVDQKNVLIRIVLRSLSRSLTHHEANELRDRIYAAVHRGARTQWAARSAD